MEDLQKEISLLQTQNEKLLTQVEKLTKDKKKLLEKMADVKDEMAHSLKWQTETGNRWKEDRNTLLNEISRIVTTHNDMVDICRNKIEEIRRLLKSLNWEDMQESQKILSAISDLGDTLNSKHKRNPEKSKKSNSDGDKLLFVDVGGVIADVQTQLVDSKAMQTLQNIITTTGCKLVLTSDYRRRKQLEKNLRQQLSKLNLEDQFIGCTPILDECSRRKEEIRLFLNQYDSKGGAPRWLVVDDWPLAQRDDRFEGHVIQTSRNGLNSEHADAVISLFADAPQMEKNNSEASVI